MNQAEQTTQEKLPEPVLALVAAMSIFEWDTSQHLVATSVLASRIAARMDLDAGQIEDCRLAAILHDVGMLAVNSSIITHPSMLAESEWEVLIEHPARGAELLSAIPSLAHLAPIVRAHHERMDGTGYPDALMGEEIPIEARIIAVADAFHTMTVPTAYRSANGASAAMAELVGNAGSQFDERIVEAFGVSVNYRRRLRRA